MNLINNLQEKKLHKKHPEEKQRSVIPPENKWSSPDAEWEEKREDAAFKSHTQVVQMNFVLRFEKASTLRREFKWTKRPP